MADEIQSTLRVMFFEAAEEEFFDAIEKRAPMNSAHEGYAVILEEVLELQAEVFKKREERDPQRMYEELLQIAAMAARMAVDVVEKMEARRG